MTWKELKEKVDNQLKLKGLSENSEVWEIKAERLGREDFSADKTLLIINAGMVVAWKTCEPE